jgi:hypothetical protein
METVERAVAPRMQRTKKGDKFFRFLTRIFLIRAFFEDTGPRRLQFESRDRGKANAHAFRCSALDVGYSMFGRGQRKAYGRQLQFATGDAPALQH